MHSTVILVPNPSGRITPFSDKGVAIQKCILGKGERYTVNNIDADYRGTWVTVLVPPLSV